MIDKKRENGPIVRCVKLVKISGARPRKPQTPVEEIHKEATSLFRRYRDRKWVEESRRYSHKLWSGTLAAAKRKSEISAHLVGECQLGKGSQESDDGEVKAGDRRGRRQI